jgi:hypothetical protein
MLPASKGGGGAVIPPMTCCRAGHSAAHTAVDDEAAHASGPRTFATWSAGAIVFPSSALAPSVKPAVISSEHK